VAQASRLARALRSEALRVTGFATTFALVFSWPMLGHLATPGTLSDWDMLLGLKWAAYETIVKYHQLPLWNPYRCGGLAMLGNPQSQIVSPFFPLTLLFNPFLGTHLQMIVCLAVAWSGGYVLARVVGISPLGAVAAAMVFPASSWFYLRLGIGHVVALETTYVPWGCAAFWWAVDRDQYRYAALAGLVFALAFLGGGPDGVVYGGVELAVLALALAILRRSWRPLWMLAIAGAFAAGFAAVKLIPAWVLVSAHPRLTTDEREVSDARLLMTLLFSQDQSLFRGMSNGWGFWEGGAYVGFFAIPALLGFLKPRAAAPWIIVGVVLLLLARGDAQPLAIWPLLHQLPIFNSMRLPTRFLAPFTIVVGMLTGFGIDFMRETWTRWGAVISVAVIFLATVNCLLIGPPILDAVLQQPAAPAAPAPEFRQVTTSPGNSSMLIPAMENKGVVDCYDYTQWPTNVRPSGRPGYRGEQYLLGPGALTLEGWTPNALTFAVDVSAPAEIVVNQNYDRWWRVVAGSGIVVDENGLIGVRVPPGKRRIKIAYRDYGALIGMLITVATIAVLVVVWRNERDGMRGDE
jgi:hypothetical protein